MKRSDALRPLSEEHHLALVAARGLRRAGRGDRPLAEAVAWFMAAWRAEIQPHFRAEEEYLLPAFAQAAPPHDPLIVRTLVEHVALRRAVHALERAEAGDLALAAEIGQALDDHIRFEERVLFPAIEAALAGPRLAELGTELLAAAAAPRVCPALPEEQR